MNPMTEKTVRELECQYGGWWTVTYADGEQRIINCTPSRNILVYAIRQQAIHGSHIIRNRPVTYIKHESRPNNDG